MVNMPKILEENNIKYLASWSALTCMLGYYSNPSEISAREIISKIRVEIDMQSWVVHDLILALIVHS
jgi:hypothetical protein